MIVPPIQFDRRFLLHKENVTDKTRYSFRPPDEGHDLENGEFLNTLSLITSHQTNTQMKAKVIIALMVCAVVTLSFTFSSHKAKKESTTTSVAANEAVGGLASEDPIK